MIEFSNIFYPFALFIFILIFHILIWRIRRPKKQIISMFLIFIIIPGLIILASFCIFLIVKIKLISIEDLLLMLLLYIGLAGVYIQTYPSIQAGSPSLLIINIIGRSKKPIDKVKIQRIMKKDDFINDRLVDLEVERLIKYKDSDDSIAITRKGLILSDIFILYRKFIGLKEGEG